MDKKSKIFFVVFFGAIFLSVFATYYRYFVSQNYFIQVEGECDPETQKCFLYECDPEVDEDCPEDESERASYYKLINKKAYAVPDCDPNDENCPPLECLSGEDCEEIYCSEELLEEEDGVVCSDPEQYLIQKIEAEALSALEPKEDETDGGGEAAQGETEEPSDLEDDMLLENPSAEENVQTTETSEEDVAVSQDKEL